VSADNKDNIFSIGHLGLPAQKRLYFLCQSTSKIIFLLSATTDINKKHEGGKIKAQHATRKISKHSTAA
jgi:hypothetical protein